MPEATFDPDLFHIETQGLGSDLARIKVYIPCSYPISQVDLAGADWLSADNLYDADSEDKANHPPRIGSWVFDSLSWLGYGKPTCKALLWFSYPRGRKVPPEQEVIELVSDLLPDLTRRVSEYRETMARRYTESKATQEKRMAEQNAQRIVSSGVKQARGDIMRAARERIGLDEVLAMLRDEMEVEVKKILAEPRDFLATVEDVFVISGGTGLNPDSARELADKINTQVKGDVSKMVKLWDNPFG